MFSQTTPSITPLLQSPTQGAAEHVPLTAKFISIQAATSGNPSSVDAELPRRVIFFPGRDVTAGTSATRFARRVIEYLVHEGESLGAEVECAYYAGTLLTDEKLESMLNEYYRQGNKSAIALESRALAMEFAQ